MEQDEQECSLGAFAREAIAVACSDAFEQAMGFQFAKVVTELGKGIGSGG